MRGRVFVLFRGERRATSRRERYVSEREVKMMSYESIAEAWKKSEVYQERLIIA